MQHVSLRGKRVCFFKRKALMIGEELFNDYILSYPGKAVSISLNIFHNINVRFDSDSNSVANYHGSYWTPG